MTSIMNLLVMLKKIGKMQDSISTGLLGGLLGTLFMDISNLIIFKAGKTETLYGNIAGGLWVAPFRTKQKKNFVLGQLTHFGIGSIWGVLLVQLLKKTGKDHYLIKGLFVSMLSLGTLIGGQKVGLLKKLRLTKTLYSAVWNHIVYGLTSAQAIVWLADSEIFKSNKANRETSGRVQTDLSFPTLVKDQENAIPPKVAMH